MKHTGLILLLFIFLFIGISTQICVSNEISIHTMQDGKTLVFSKDLIDFSETFNNLLENQKEKAIIDTIPINEGSQEELIVIHGCLEIVSKQLHKKKSLANTIQRTDGKFILKNIYSLLAKKLNALSLNELIKTIKLINFLDIVDRKKSSFLLETSINIFAKKIVTQKDQLFKKFSGIDCDDYPSLIMCLLTSTDLTRLTMEYINLHEQGLETKYDIGDCIEMEEILISSKKYGYTLKLNNKKITHLDGLECYGFIKSIKSLHLSSNYITEVPLHTFEKLGIVQLKLNNNPITIIKPPKQSNTSLELLDLSDTSLTELTLDMFNQLPALKTIKLRKVYLEEIHENSIPTGTYLSNLKYIILPESPFHTFIVERLATLINHPIEVPLQQGHVRNKGNTYAAKTIHPLATLTIIPSECIKINAIDDKKSTTKLIFLVA